MSRIGWHRHWAGMGEASGVTVTPNIIETAPGNADAGNNAAGNESRSR
jgi:hypothetical protein